ncbi:MAG TPA: tetraacyldisaccharide 4'-kinase [Isosphaeraceae bacterium]
MKPDPAAYLRLVRGQSRGIGPSLLRLGLAGAALPYRMGVAARNLAFDRGWKTIERAGVPVISVGNLTLGGTGKTPMVEYVARWGRSRGLRVAILSRGYGQDEGLNDEGRVLEENLPDVPHLQGRDRAALAGIAVEELESELLVLDDGFQHRRLARDLDIVLLDALDPFGLGRIFPTGLLREPIGSLRRAGVVVLSRGDLVSEAERLSIRARAERSAGPLAWAVARHAPLGLLGEGVPEGSLGSLGDRAVAAFCGIGNPEGFRRTLEGIGARVVGFRAFPDHHLYTAQDMTELTRWTRDLGAELALTTQKDSVKLRAATLGPVPLRALRIGLEVVEGEDVLLDALARVAPAPTD